jgi:RNA polymerase primary sigma factor
MKAVKVKNPEEFRLYNQYLRDIRKYPLLSGDEEKKVLQQVQKGSRKARDKLVCSNLKFVIKVAFLYRGQGLTLTELINEGNIGLIEAAVRYDAAKKVKFTSYAVWWIRQSIVQAIFEKARLVRISAQKELILRRIGKNSPVVKQFTGGSSRIDAESLAEKMGYTPEQMEKILEMGQQPSSLNAPLFSDSNDAYIDVIKDTSFGDSDSSAEEKSLHAFLSRALERLSSKERKVIELFFGFGYNRAFTLGEIGEIFMLSKERVRQIKESGLEKLKHMKLEKGYLLAA